MKNQYFFWTFVSSLALIYFSLVWIPQFLHVAFTPAVLTSPLKGLGMDLYALYCSAQLMLQGHSARLFDPAAFPVYPYPIGGAIQSYGALAVMLFVPFIHFSFHRVYLLWLVVALSILVFLSSRIVNYSLPNLKNTVDLFPRFFYILAFFAVLVVFSGPINLLFERGQLEIIIPFLLYFVWEDFVNEKESLKTAILLGLAIHIKVWPLALVAIFLRNRRFGLFALALFTPVFFNIIFNHWLPVSQLIASTQAYAHASSQMVGWISVSLYSLLAVIGLPLDWKLLSCGFYLLMGLTTLFFLIKKYQDERKFKNLFFAFIIIYSILTPAFTCDYVLVSALILYLCINEAHPTPTAAILLAIPLSCLLLFQSYAGPFKVCCLLSLMVILILQMLKNSLPAENSAII